MYEALHPLHGELDVRMENVNFHSLLAIYIPTKINSSKTVSPCYELTFIFPKKKTLPLYRCTIKQIFLNAKTGCQELHSDFDVHMAHG